MRRVLVIVLVIAVLGFGASRGLDWWALNVNTPISSTSHVVVFHVDPGETPTQIGQDLFNLGLIRNTIAFDLYTRLTNAGPKLEAGVFVLNRTMSLAAIVNALQHGKAAQKAITFPEGFPIREQAKVVESKGVGTAHLGGCEQFVAGQGFSFFLQFAQHIMRHCGALASVAEFINKSARSGNPQTAKF